MFLVVFSCLFIKLRLRLFKVISYYVLERREKMHDYEIHSCSSCGVDILYFSLDRLSPVFSPLIHTQPEKQGSHDELLFCRSLWNSICMFSKKRGGEGRRSRKNAHDVLVNLHPIQTDIGYLLRLDAFVQGLLGRGSCWLCCYLYFLQSGCTRVAHCPEVRPWSRRPTWRQHCTAA